MIRKLLLFFAVFTCGLIYAQQQVIPDQVRQVSVQNGFVIYESRGVEGFQPAAPVTAPNPVPAAKPVSEWNIQECDEALYFIDLKLQVAIENHEQESIDRYQQNKNEILARRSVLTNQIQGQ